MLTPEQLGHYPDALVELWARTEQSIIADMARRINGFDLFIPSAQWQLTKVKEMGQVEEYILQELAAQSYRSWDDLKALMTEAGMKTLEFDDHIYERAGLTPAALKDSPALQAVLLAGLEKTNGLFKNLTNSAAAAGSRQFERTLDLAYMQVTTGAFSHTEAIKHAIKQLSRGGLEAVVYDSGRVEHLDVAVRRAVLTGVNQTAAKLQLARADEMGCDLVEVTAHAGARPSHAVWQGGIYSRSGRNDNYENFEYATGYGTGSGLCGWNCRHSFFPYFEGISRPAYTKDELEQFNAKNYEYNGVQMTEYEATQKQRYIERQIRRWKREEQGMKAAGLPTEEAKAKIAHWNRVQKDFLKQTGLKRQYDREWVYAAKEKGDILTKKETAALRRYISSDSYKINEKLRNGQPLSANEEKLVQALDSALEKLPVYQGKVYRSVDSSMMKDEVGFNKLHSVGNLVIYKQFTSSSMSVHDESFKYQLIIESKSGKSIVAYNPNEQEVLFGRDVQFIVNAREGNTIYMEEVHL